MNNTLRIVVVGHVDHGKSTLVGRLLHDTGALPEGKVETLRDVCTKRGMPFEWAFVMDALQAERDQGITIDTTQVRFRAGARDVVLIDAPGHKEFLKNMVTGAAGADAALLIVDAVEGVREQSRRHGYLLHLLGLTQVTVVVNKMDAVDWSETRFREVEAEIRGYLGGIGVTPAHVLPIAARHGANVVETSAELAWYHGPTITQALESFTPPVEPAERALRFPIQDVYKFDDRRIIAGRIESGRLRVGDTLVFAPSGKKAKIASIEAWQARTPVLAAGPGQSVGITLDDQIFVERGHLAHHPEAAPAEGSLFRARVFWLGKVPLKVGERYRLKLATAERQVTVAAIDNVVDVEDLSSGPADTVERNAVAEVVFRSKGALPFDDHTSHPRTGRFVLIQDYDIVGGGIVSLDGHESLERGQDVPKSTDITAVAHRVTPESRWQINGHRGGIVWLTGLSGAGKSTLAMELERQLVQKGYQAFVLDGDNVRHGLCADLGFSPEDREENIRRVGEVAHLFAEAGHIVITAFISPYRADREKVRRMRPERFHEIHVAADLETCRSRDPKGLYAKAGRGEISNFTGIDAPYEPPLSADLVVDTAVQKVDGSVGRLLSYVEEMFCLDTRKRERSL